MQYANRGEKVDDDDGHYVVNPNTPLTDRCKQPEFQIIMSVMHTNLVKTQLSSF